MVDLYTDIFNVLNIRDFDNAFNELVSNSKRAAFIFNTSTTVMPILCCAACFVFLAKNKFFEVFIIIGALIISAITTASTAGFIMLASILIPISFNKKYLLSIIIFMIFLYFYESDIFSGQINRVINNDADSESNIGRIEQWYNALHLISNFDVLEHIAGIGLGVTNEKFYVQTYYPHGESTYFQSYIEAGILGTFLRVLPIIIGIKNSYNFSQVIFLYILALFINFCVAPIFSLIPLQIFMGLLIGSASYLKNYGKL